MPENSLLISGFLAQYACQAIIALFMGSVFLTLSRWKDRPVIRWWVLGWFALAAYLFCAVVGLQLRDVPSWSVGRIVLGTVTLSAAILQGYFFLGGWLAERSGKMVAYRKLALRALLVVAICVPISVLIHLPTIPMEWRMLLKVQARSLLLGAVFLYIGVSSYRNVAIIRSIRLWLSAGMTVFGLRYLAFALIPTSPGVEAFEREFVLQFIDLALHMVVGTSMALLVCFDYVRIAARQSQELERRASMLAEQDQRLDQKRRLEAIGRMAAGVAHDFNNLLTVVYSWTDILRHDANLDKAGIEGVNAIEKAAKQAGAISQKLMLFGRRKTLQPTMESPADLVAASCELVPNLDSRVLEVDVPDSLPMIRIDRAQFIAALQNVLINAVEATLTGGNIKVSGGVETLPEDDGGDQQLPPGEYLRLAVEDDGAGISAEALEHLFEPFFTTKRKGNGLGLASALGFARQSGGGLVAESVAGKGASLIFLVPVAMSPEGEPQIDLPRPPELRAPAPRPKHALVVDDEAAIARFVGRILSRADYQITSTGDPEHAKLLALELGDRLDVVVTDVRMPGMTGPELVSHLRSSRPDIGVVFVTGYADEAELSGISGDVEPTVLQKPVSEESLLEAVHQQVTACQRVTRTPRPGTGAEGPDSGSPVCRGL